MKRLLTMMMVMFAAMFATLAAIGGTMFPIGETGEFTDGAMIKGVVIASTNTTQTATIKAVYTWPIVAEQTNDVVDVVSYQELYTRVDTLTNWCNWVTDTYTVDDGTTNYYAGITIATNDVMRTVEKSVTNKIVWTVKTGEVAVTNTLYSLTASGGVATNLEKSVIGAGAKLLIEDWPVTVFWE